MRWDSLKIISNCCSALNNFHPAQVSYKHLLICNLTLKYVTEESHGNHGFKMALLLGLDDLIHVHFFCSFYFCKGTNCFL